MYTSKTRTLSGVMAGLMLAGGVGLVPGTTNTALALEKAQKKFSQEKAKEIQNKKGEAVRLFTKFVLIEGAVRDKEEVQKFLQQHNVLLNGLNIDRQNITTLLEKPDSDFSLEYWAKLKKEDPKSYEKLNLLTRNFDDYVRKSAHLYTVGHILAKSDGGIRFNKTAKISAGVAGVAYLLEQQIVAYLALAVSLVSIFKGQPSRSDLAAKLTGKLADNASMTLLYLAPDSDPTNNNLPLRKEAAEIIASGLPISATAFGFAKEIDDKRRNGNVEGGKLESLISQTAFTAPTLPPLGLNVTQYRKAVEGFVDLLVSKPLTAERLAELRNMDVPIETKPGGAVPRTVNLGKAFDIQLRVLEATVKEFGDPEWKAENVSSTPSQAVPIARTAQKISGNFYMPEDSRIAASIVIPASAIRPQPQSRFAVLSLSG